MDRRRSRIRGWFLLACLLEVPVGASNGFNLIGFGAESSLLAGADLALVTDTTALNSNPAGLAQIDQRWDLYVAALNGRVVRHRDSLGNDAQSHRGTVLAANVGYAKRFGDGPWVGGTGILTQGGAGSDFRDLRTAFATTDSMSSTFGLGKLSIGLARQGREWDLGLSAALSYAKLDLALFPRTSVVLSPDQAFFGLDLQGSEDLALGLKLGFRYRASRRWVVAGAYSSPLKLSLDGGALTLDYTALGLGTVTYREASFSGIGFAGEVGLGVAFELSTTVALTGELSWLDWSGVNRISRLVARSPSDPAAPPEIEVLGPLHWRDQLVLALGVSWQVSDRTKVLGGYNYGRNPIPADSLNPLFVTIGEHHLACGMRRLLAHGRAVTVGLEAQLKSSVTYTNPNLPFGPAQADVALLNLHLSFSFGG